ncbi:MAG: hypothetical protein ABIQ16_10425 [Polyangiaceae bacterium]
MKRIVWVAGGAGALLACGGSAESLRDGAGGASHAGSSIGGHAGRTTGDGAGGVVAGGTGLGGYAQGGRVGDGEAGAGQGGQGGDAGGLSLGPGSWNFTGSVKLAGPNAQAVSCDHLDFALTVNDDGITVGRNGEMYFNKQVTVADDSYFSASLRLPKGPACSANTLVAKDFRVHGVDKDGDGSPDQLEGTVGVELTVIQGDVGYTVALTTDLVGIPDDEAPELSAPGSALNPLDRPSVWASEPLLSSTALRLTGTSEVPLLPQAQTDPLATVIRFASSQILPFGGSWTVAGTGQDLSNHSLVVRGTASTLADPGVQAQDGFEGTLIALKDAGASLVAGVGSVGALSGAHSLLLEPNATITLHLQRSGSENKLHFAMRALSIAESSLSYVFMRSVTAGVIGGDSVVTLNAAALPSSAATQTGDTRYPFASAVRAFDAVLTEPGADVLLRIANAPCGPCPPPSAWLIDDLTLQ